MDSNAPHVTYYAGQIRVPSDEWTCDYCGQPLGLRAVTVVGGYAHEDCDPLSTLMRQMITVHRVTDNTTA